MSHCLRWCLFLVSLTVLLPLLPLAPAAADEDEGGAVLDAGLQWQIASSAWNRREYEDAAALYTTFANANPDDENTLEALWRTYNVYARHRPNPERRKLAYEKAMSECERWDRKYGGKDAYRLAQSLWYRANLQEGQGERAGAIRFLQELQQRAIGTKLDADVYWALADWLNKSKRYQEAIPQYAAYRQTVGATDYAALTCFRQAECHLRLNDSEGAVAAYKEILTGKYNWRGGHLYGNAMDAAKQLRALGEEELARSYALNLLEKGPPHENLQNAARLFLGDRAKKRVIVYPHCYNSYTTDHINIDARTKLERAFSMHLLVRLSFVSKEEPFAGVLRVRPKQTMTSLPENMQVEDKQGKTVHVARFQAPDEKGHVPGDTWFRFGGGVMPPDTVPDQVVISRKWEKIGNTWGESTIRIQSSARWELRITLPNTHTNPDNVTPKPYSVQDGGKTFYWPAGSYDPTHGITFKFPVEVSATVRECYPLVTLWRSVPPPFTGKDVNSTTAELDFPWFHIAMTSPEEFPCSFPGQASTTVTMNAVVK